MPPPFDCGGAEPLRRRLTLDKSPALELVELHPENRRQASAPLLFVHGAFAGAWCWCEHFLGLFAQQGRHAAAIDLRGHGGSDGHDVLRTSGLDDLADDLERAIAAMAEPPVVVAHSLGGYLSQLLIRRVRMRGLVLLGSLPPDGMALVGPRLSLADTKIWSQALTATLSDSRATIDLAGLQILFGEGIPRERALRYGARLISESPRALAEAHLPRPIFSASMAGLPTLVLNGAEDRLVWPADALRTAVYHGAQYQLVDGGGHFLMLDPGAAEVASRIAAWLEKRGL